MLNHVWQWTLFGKLLLVGARALAVAGPVAIGSIMSAPPLRAQTPAAAEAPLAFEVASIKPSDPASRGMRLGYAPGGRFTANGITVKSLVAFAYGVREFQISGGPSWISSDKYDIVAKPEAGSDADDPKKIADDEQREIFERRQRQRLQTLLADRFQLKLTRNTKELPVYALVIAKNGPKLRASKEEGANRFPGVRMGGPGHLEGAHVPMKFLIQVLSQNVGRPVIDQTGLNGKYDFKLEWTPDQNQPNPFGGGPGGPGVKDTPPPADPNGPSIFTAIQEQLGLKLDSQKGPVEMLTIGAVEKPSDN